MSTAKDFFYDALSTTDKDEASSLMSDAIDAHLEGLNLPNVDDMIDADDVERQIKEELETGYLHEDGLDENLQQWVNQNLKELIDAATHFGILSYWRGFRGFWYRLRWLITGR